MTKDEQERLGEWGNCTVVCHLLTLSVCHKSCDNELGSADTTDWLGRALDVTTTVKDTILEAGVKDWISNKTVQASNTKQQWLQELLQRKLHTRTGQSPENQQNS